MLTLRRRLPAAVLVMLIAGCTAPSKAPLPNEGLDCGSPTGACVGSAPPLQMDLKNHGLSIDMPGGNSTALVVLKVTQDLWVPWRTTWLHDLQIDSARWTLCLRVDTSDIPDGTSLAVVVKRLEGGVLTDFQSGTAVHWPVETNGSAVPDCLVQSWGPYPESGLTSPDPMDVQVAVIVSALRATPRSEPFTFTLAVGSEPCPRGNALVTDTTIALWCGPEHTLPWQPLQSNDGGMKATFSTDPFFCPCAGFRVDDQRTQLGTASQGSLTLRLLNESQTSLTLARLAATAPSPVPGFINPIGPAAETLRLRAEFHEGETSAECTSVRSHYAGTVVGIQGWAPSMPALQATWNTAGLGNVHARAYQIPLNLESLGWSLAPASWRFSETGVDGAPAETDCLS